MLNMAGAVAFTPDTPLPSDSRIKTFIYNENDVYRVVVHYGYQTSIEFSEGEEITTLSIGNNYAWQLTPVGRRLFIKPLEENIITNMTILTNKRAYHFEVQSKLITYTTDEELAYVIRFFYPDEEVKKPKTKSMAAAQPAMAAEQPAQAMPMVVSGGANNEHFRFGYQASCESKIAPIQVFDNGVNTFFRFDYPDNSTPRIFIKKFLGYKELEQRQRGDFIVVNDVGKKFRIEHMGEFMHVHRR